MTSIDSYVQQLDQFLLKLNLILQQQLIAVYLYGSFADGSPGPESDVDLLVFLNAPLNDKQRLFLNICLLQISAPPNTQNLRSLEVTMLEQSEIHNRTYPLKYELQYGEWLRAELLQDTQLCAQHDPDLTILIRKAQQHSQLLYGKDILSHSSPVSDLELLIAMNNTYPQIVAHWDEDQDERNQVLALCRILYTLTFKEIAAKHVAAQWFFQFLEDEKLKVLQLMVDEYTGQVTHQDWSQYHAQLSMIVKNLEEKITHTMQAQLKLTEH